MQRYKRAPTEGWITHKIRMQVNIKGKYIIGVVILILLIVSVNLSSRKLETTIYIGVSNPSENIDLLVRIDGSKIFDDTIKYNPVKYVIIKENLKGGFHKIYVHSDKENLTKEKSIFLLFGQHVVIEYFPKNNENEEGSNFFIRNRLTPFYLE